MYLLEFIMWYFQLSQLDAFYLHLANWFYISSCKSYFILLAIGLYWKLHTALYPNFKIFIWFEIDISAVGMYVCVFQQTKIFFWIEKSFFAIFSTRQKMSKLVTMLNRSAGFFLTKQQSTYANAFGKKVITKRSTKL